ncbi:MAG: hypothetical protein J5817_07425, partial [Treponema sp.]|nr:hypothetical protein [Treponema sp.]
MKKLSVCAFSFLLFLALCIIFSCSGLSGSFNQDVHEYFDMMTNTAAIEKHDIPAPTQTGSGGRLCISSADGPVTVSYYLRNPKLFPFSEARGNLISSNASTISSASDIVVKQHPTDPSVITVKYPTNFLREMDGKLDTDGNYCSITESVNIKHPYSLEDFGTYSFPLYCNSTPPLMQGGVCLADDENPSHNVLFMNLPNTDILKFIHKDLAYIRIDGTRFAITVDDNGAVDFTPTENFKILNSITSSNVDASTGNITYDSHTYTRFATGSNAVFAPGPSGTTLFYKTNDALSAEKSYKVELVDKMGFTSSIEIGAKATQIGEVTYQNQNGDTVQYTDSQGAVTTGLNTIYGDDGKAYLVLVPPADAPNAVLSYRIYKDDGSFVVSGKVNGKKSIPVPCPEVAGEEEVYTIKAYAHQNLFADSAESTCTVKTKASTYFGGGGITTVDDIIVWVDGVKLTENTSSYLQRPKGGLEIGLHATPANANIYTENEITEGIEWNWEFLLAGQPSTAISPNHGDTNNFNIDTQSCNTGYIYQLKIT